MDPPIKPDESDCCNSGCNPCILDVYEEQIKKYKALQTKVTADYINCIKPTSYTCFKLVKNEKHTPTTNLLTFEYSRPLRTSGEQSQQSNKPMKFLYIPGQNILLKSSHLGSREAFTRAYTPIPVEGMNEVQFTVLVRLYEHGQMSRYLKRLKIGDVTLWRGPYGDFNLQYDYQHMLCVAQGTGIAPVYAVIRALLDNEDCDTFVNLFFCCRDCNEILLRDSLYDLASHWNFKYEIYLSNCENVTERYNEVINRRKLDMSDVRKFMESKNNTRLHVLICGSDTFSETMRGYVNDCSVSNCDVYVF